MTWPVTLFTLASCDLCPPKDLLLSKPNNFHYAAVFGSADLKDASPSIVHHGTEYFTPASCQKILTGLLFYKALGRDFRYTTSLYKSVPQKGGNPKDRCKEIILSFSGDPTLTSAEVSQLLSPLKGRRFPAHLVVDLSAFQLPEWSENWMIDDQGPGSLISPVSAAILDHNFVELKVSPTKPGEKAKLETLSTLVHHFSVMTSNQKMPPVPLKISWEKDVLQITGTLAPNAAPFIQKISPPSSQLLLQAKLKKILKDLGIRFTKGLKFVSKRSSLPSRQIFLNKHESQRLVDFLPQAMKSSDNLVFDALYLTLLHQRDPSCKTWKEGDKIIKQAAAQHLCLDLGKSLIVDGSGLSRYNRLQPLLLWKILQKGYAYKEFIKFLASPGEAGSTLQKRKGLPPEIRGKTGTLSGVSCLCGYLLDARNPEAFVLQFNNFAPPLKDILNKQEKILRDRYVTK